MLTFASFLLAEEAARSPMPLDLTMLGLLALMFVVFVFLPMRRDRRARARLMAALKKNDRVVVNGFLIGTVAQISKADKPDQEDELLLKIDDNANIKMRVLRSSVTRVLRSEEAAKDPKDGGA